VRCDCCGWDGEDEVTQYLIEEASFEFVELEERLAEHRQGEQAVSPHQAAAARHAELTGKT